MTDSVTSDIQKKSYPPSRIAGLKPIQPGETRNPGGKPKGSKNRLQGDFMRRLADDFERFGIYAIARMRRDDPAAYVRAIASLMPKEVTVTHDAIDELSDDQLDAAIAAVRAVLAAQDPAGPQGTAQGSEPAASLSTVQQAG